MEESFGNDGFDDDDNPDDLWLQDNMDWDYPDEAEEEPDEEDEEQAPPTKQLRVGATPSLPVPCDKPPNPHFLVVCLVEKRKGCTTPLLS